MDEKVAEIIRTEIEPKIDKIIRELDGILDSKTLKEAEELHKRLSYLSTDDLLKQFTI